MCVDKFFIGMINKIELWDRTQLDKIDKDNTKQSSSFEELANEIKF